MDPNEALRDELDLRWRREQADRLARQPWWDDWCAFRETLGGFNPQDAFAAGWKARELRDAQRTPEQEEEAQARYWNAEAERDWERRNMIDIDPARYAE